MTTNTNNASRRIAQVNIPGNQHSVIGLTRIYGVGRNRASEILKKLKIEETKKINELTEKEISAISQLIEKEYKTEGNRVQKIPVLL